MESTNNKTQQLNSSNIYYFSLVIVLAFFSFFHVNSVAAQNSIQSNETSTEELDWNVGIAENNELTPEEQELARETALAWEKWDAEHPVKSAVVISKEESKELNKVKSPTEILMSALVGYWEGFYGGSKAYINFKENKTVVINTSVFSNVPSASGREHTQLYYEIDASQSPYKLIFYNRDREIKGVFRILDNNQITICHNFKNDEQPKDIDNKYTIINFYKIENTKQQDQQND